MYNKRLQLKMIAPALPRVSRGKTFSDEHRAMFLFDSSRVYHREGSLFQTYQQDHFKFEFYQYLPEKKFFEQINLLLMGEVDYSFLPEIMLPQAFVLPDLTLDDFIKEHPSIADLIDHRVDKLHFSFKPELGEDELLHELLSIGIPRPQAVLFLRIRQSHRNDMNLYTVMKSKLRGRIRHPLKKGASLTVKRDMEPTMIRVAYSQKKRLLTFHTMSGELISETRYVPDDHNFSKSAVAHQNTKRQIQLFLTKWVQNRVTEDDRDDYKTIGPHFPEGIGNHSLDVVAGKTLVVISGERGNRLEYKIPQEFKAHLPGKTVRVAPALFAYPGLQKIELIKGIQLKFKHKRKNRVLNLIKTSSRHLSQFDYKSLNIPVEKGATSIEVPLIDKQLLLDFPNGNPAEVRLEFDEEQPVSESSMNNARVRHDTHWSEYIPNKVITSSKKPDIWLLTNSLNFGKMVASDITGVLNIKYNYNRDSGIIFFGTHGKDSKRQYQISSENLPRPIKIGLLEENSRCKPQVYGIFEEGYLKAILPFYQHKFYRLHNFEVFRWLNGAIIDSSNRGLRQHHLKKIRESGQDAIIIERLIKWRGKDIPSEYYKIEGNVVSFQTWSQKSKIGK